MARFFGKVLTMMSRLITDEGGWGHLDFEVGQGPLRVHLSGSQEARWLGPADQPVCHFYRGIVAGYAGTLSGEDVHVEEIACHATGAARCTFLVGRCGPTVIFSGNPLSASISGTMLTRSGESVRSKYVDCLSIFRSCHQNQEEVSGMRLSWKGTIALLAVGLAMTIGGTACAVVDYCEAQTDCYGGNIKDERACRAYIRGERNAATKYGCRTEFNKMLKCEADNAVCDQGDYYTPNSECDDEYEDYSDCIDGASGYDDDGW